MRLESEKKRKNNGNQTSQKTVRIRHRKGTKKEASHTTQKKREKIQPQMKPNTTRPPKTCKKERTKKEPKVQAQETTSRLIIIEKQTNREQPPGEEPKHHDFPTIPFPECSSEGEGFRLTNNHS